ncbi:MAG: DUF559 domain-containing protein, partial [Halothiobacillus sp.]|nr:DUF559 domain-containing protein [Halothiobacillus sp.]
IGSYIADFAARNPMLVIELDGAPHQNTSQKKKDQKRDAYLKSQGLTVLRFENKQWLDNPETVLEEIVLVNNASPPGRGRERVNPNGKPLPINGLRDRRGEVLFIDARQLGFMKDRVLRDFTPEDIQKIAGTFHKWQALTQTLSQRERANSGRIYTDIAGFCKSATLKEIAKHDYVLTPGRYVGAAAEEDDGEPFADKMERLTAELKEQFAESERLEGEIKDNLAGLGFNV